MQTPRRYATERIATMSKNRWRNFLDEVASGMTAQEIKSLPISEKIEIMEAIWEDLRDRIGHTEPSPQIKNLLDQRRARVGNGTTKLLDWDSVKNTIGKS